MAQSCSLTLHPERTAQNSRKATASRRSTCQETGHWRRLPTAFRRQRIAGHRVSGCRRYPLPHSSYHRCSESGASLLGSWQRGESRQPALWISHRVRIIGSAGFSCSPRHQPESTACESLHGRFCRSWSDIGALLAKRGGDISLDPCVRSKLLDDDSADPARRSALLSAGLFFACNRPWAIDNDGYHEIATHGLAIT